MNANELDVGNLSTFLLQLVDVFDKGKVSG